MVERYDLTINRNEDNIIYNFPYFDIGITLTGEKMDTEPVTPEPEPEENVIDTIFQTPLESPISGNTNIDILTGNGNTVGQFQNNNSESQTEIKFQPIINHINGTNGNGVNDPVPDSTVISSYDKCFALAFSQTTPNILYIAYIHPNSGNSITLNTLNYPSNTNVSFYTDNNYNGGWTISTYSTKCEYDDDSQKIQLYFPSTLAQRVSVGDSINWYKINTSPFIFFRSSTPQPFLLKHVNNRDYTLTKLVLQTNTTTTLAANETITFYNSSSLNKQYYNYSSMNYFLSFVDINTLSDDNTVWYNFIIVEKSKYNRIFYTKDTCKGLKDRIDMSYPYKRLILICPFTYTYILYFKNYSNGLDNDILYINCSSNSTVYASFYSFNLPTGYSLGYSSPLTSDITQCFGKILFTNLETNTSPVINGSRTTPTDPNAYAIELLENEHNSWTISNTGTSFYDMTYPLTITLNGETLFEYSP